MIDGQSILRTLIELLEEQEEIKINYEFGVESENTLGN